MNERREQKKRVTSGGYLRVVRGHLSVEMTFEKKLDVCEGTTLQTSWEISDLGVCGVCMVGTAKVLWSVYCRHFTAELPASLETTFPLPTEGGSKGRCMDWLKAIEDKSRSRLELSPCDRGSPLGSGHSEAP